MCTVCATVRDYAVGIALRIVVTNYFLIISDLLGKKLQYSD